MPIMSNNDDSNVESDLSLILSALNESLFTKGAHSDYDMCSLSSNDLDTHVEKGFSLHANSNSYDTMPIKHVTREN